MKFLLRLDVAAWVGVLLFAACAGDVSSERGTSREPTDDEELPPPDPDALLRNPAHPLSCERPLTENPSSSQLSRLTHRQYVNTLRDLFAGSIDETALPRTDDLSDELKEGTFSNNVMGQLGSEGITQAREAAVWTVAGAAVKDLRGLMGCQPENQAAEAACVDGFIEKFGLRAWRRPLTDDERGAAKTLFADARAALPFADAVRTVVGGLLQSPQFLYRIMAGTGEVGEGQSLRLSDYEMAANLSYLIWNTMPDSALFAAASKGELNTGAQLEKQALRMLDDPRAHENIRLFQREWLQVERLETQAGAGVKDKGVYPGYGAPQAAALLGGLEAYLEDSFWQGDHSLTSFLSSSRGFVNDASAAIYGVDQPGSAELVGVDLDPAQRKGILTQPFILAGWANDKAQSAILRGAFVMEHILCAPAPPPPMDIERKLVELPNRDEVTLRQVVESTVEQGSCSGCHEVIDGFGFLYENYDGIGAYQDKERHLDIDASNDVIGTLDLDGHYDNAVQFADALGKSEQAAQCVVQLFYEFATARHPVEEDGCVIAPLTTAFLKNGTDLQKLVIDVIKSPAFRYRGVAQ